MAKNRVFKRRWTIEIKGVSTNNFMQKFIDSTLRSYVRAISDRFASIQIIGLEVEDLNKERETSKAVREIFKCPNCGAHKYTEGSTCLLCAAEEDQNVQN